MHGVVIRANTVYFSFLEKIRFDILCELLAKQWIHMISSLIFSEKIKYFRMSFARTVNTL